MSAQMSVDPAQPRPVSLSRRIHGAYSGLSTAERQIADILLSDDADLSTWQAGEVARRAGVSNASVSRFFQRLGYANFDEARQAVRTLRETGSPLYAGARTGKAPETGTIPALIAQETALVQAALSRLDTAMIVDIGGALARAKRLRTIGFRTSHVLAQYITAQLSQLRPGVAPLNLPGQTLAEGVASLGAGDLVIAIGLRRRPEGFSRMIAALAAQGVPILLLADHTVREAPAHARWSLEIPVETSQFADSYLGAMAVLRLLLLETREALGDAGRAHLERVEDLRLSLNELE